MRIAVLGQVFYLSQEGQHQRASIAMKRMVAVVGLAISAQCMSVVVMMVDGLRAGWLTARLWSGCLSNCRQSMRSACGSMRMMDYPVQRLQRYYILVRPQ